MYEHIISAILDLPTIIQGAMGSALFALVLYLMQNTAERAKNLWSLGSTNRRIEYLLAQKEKLKIILSDRATERSYYTLVLLRRTIECTLKAATMIILAQLFNSIHPLFHYAGALGSLYYLFRGISTISEIADKNTKKAAAKLSEIDLEIENLRNSGNKIQNSTAIFGSPEPKFNASLLQLIDKKPETTFSNPKDDSD